MYKAQKKRYRKLFTYKHELSTRATNAENKFKELLNTHGVAYRFQKGIFTRDPLTNKKRFRIIDFYITRLKIGIEIDGGYHFTDYGKQRDNYRNFELSRSRKSLTIWRFTNEDVLSESKEVIEQIEYLKIAQDFRMKKHRTKLSELQFLLK
jgi:very-short-patch-repair endonuclease